MLCRRTRVCDLPYCLHIPHVSIVLAPDQTVDAEVVRQTIDIGQVGKYHEEGREDAHRDHDQGIDIRRGVVGWDLIPEGIEPEPRRSGLVASLVHHPPLCPQQVQLRRLRW